MKRASINLILATIFFVGMAVPTPAAATSKVTIYVMGDFAHPLIESFFPVKNALADVEGWINSRGGVRGVPVEFVLQGGEKEAKPINLVELFMGGGGDISSLFAGLEEETISYYDKISKLEPPLVVNTDFISGSSEALKSRFDEDKIICFTTDARISTLYPPGYTYAIMPTYEDQFALFIDWLSKTEERPRLAFLTMEGIPLTSAHITEGTLAFCEQVGVKVVAQEKISLGIAALDITPQLKRIKARGANWIYLNLGGPFLQMGGASFKKAGLLGKVKLAVGSIGMDPQALLPLGELAEGAVGISPLCSWDEVDNPGIKEISKVFEREGRKPGEKSLTYLSIFTMGMVGVELIGRVVDEVGWEGLNGEAILKELEKGKEIDSLGLTICQIPPGKRSLTYARIMEVQKGKIVPISDWQPCPDMRPTIN
jgi:ABC-type branched-subunit amino acid transport system substrate-binding protein